jgi:hypothetical protein
VLGHILHAFLSLYELALVSAAVVVFLYKIRFQERVSMVKKKRRNLIVQDEITTMTAAALTTTTRFLIRVLHTYLLSDIETQIKYVSLLTLNNFNDPTESLLVSIQALAVVDKIWGVNAHL